MVNRLIAESSAFAVVIIEYFQLVAITIVLFKHRLEQTLAESRVLSRNKLSLSTVHGPSIRTAHRLGLIAF